MQVQQLAWQQVCLIYLKGTNTLCGKDAFSRKPQFKSGLHLGKNICLTTSNTTVELTVNIPSIIFSALLTHDIEPWLWRLWTNPANVKLLYCQRFEFNFFMGRKFQKALEFKQGTIFNPDKDYIWLIITDITLRTITKESLGLLKRRVFYSLVQRTAPVWTLTTLTARSLLNATSCSMNRADC